MNLVKVEILMLLSAEQIQILDLKRMLLSHFKDTSIDVPLAFPHLFVNENGPPEYRNLKFSQFVFYVNLLLLFSTSFKTRFFQHRLHITQTCIILLPFHLNNFHNSLIKPRNFWYETTRTSKSRLNNATKTLFLTPLSS